MGTTLRTGGALCKIVGLEHDTLILRRLADDPADVVELEITAKEFLAALEAGDLVVVDTPDPLIPVHEFLARNDEERKLLQTFPIDQAGLAAAEEMLIRTRWIRALMAVGYERNTRAGELDPLRLEYIVRTQGLPARTPATIAKWFAAFTLDPSSLIPKFHRRGGKGQLRSDGRALHLMMEEVERARATKQALCFQEIWAAVRVAAHHELQLRSSAVPMRLFGERTALRRFNELSSPYERDVAKLGVRRAQRKHTVTTARPKVDFPGLMSEFDDLKSGRFCMDRRTMLPFGTVWATLGVDQDSAMVTGTALGHRYRSSQSAITCIVNSIQSKERYVASHLDGAEWPAMGFPAVVQLDNARYNHPRIMQLLLEVTDFAYAKPYNPTGKREIEYFNSHVREFERDYLGGVRRKSDPEDTKEALLNTFLFVDDYDRLLHKWAVSDRGNLPRQDGFSPMQQYIESNKFSLRTLRVPDVERLKMLRMIPLPEPIRWGSSGLRYLCLSWHDPSAYTRWINRHGAPRSVRVRVDPDDLAYMYVEIPETEEILKVPSLNPDYANGLTLYQHKLVLQKSHELKKFNPSLIEVVAARKALQAEAIELMRSRSMTKRRRSLETREIVQMGSSVSCSEADVPVLEDRVHELELVEMGVEDETWQLPEDL